MFYLDKALRTSYLTLLRKFSKRKHSSVVVLRIAPQTKICFEGQRTKKYKAYVKWSQQEAAASLQHNLCLSDFLTRPFPFSPRTLLKQTKQISCVFLQPGAAKCFSWDAAALVKRQKIKINVSNLLPHNSLVGTCPSPRWLRSRWWADRPAGRCTGSSGPSGSA